MSEEKLVKETSDEWVQIEGSDFYVSKKTMESIPPAKPKEPEPEPVDTWQKVCPAPTTDEYGRELWQKQEPNDVPTRECGFSGITHNEEVKDG